MFENLHKNVNENMQIFTSYPDGPLSKQICYSLTLLIAFLVYNPFKMVVQLF